jgi:FkbM family methyltransferase
MYILFNLIPKLVIAFSGRSRLRQLKLLLQLWYFALSRKFVFGNKDMQFSFYFFGKPFTVAIESIVDLATLCEAFVFEEYKWEPALNPKIIIDLGAHFGDTTLYYHLKYPEAHIYAVEPSPRNFERLSKNVRQISNITPIFGGLADKDGFADLHIIASSMGSSFMDRSDENSSTATVPVFTLQTLMGLCNITRADIIKFDIEGAEESLFAVGAPEQFSDAYIGEVHTDLISITADSFIQHFKNFVIDKEALSNPKRFIIKAKAT